MQILKIAPRQCYNHIPQMSPGSWKSVVHQQLRHSMFYWRISSFPTITSIYLYSMNKRFSITWWLAVIFYLRATKYHQNNLGLDLRWQLFLECTIHTCLTSADPVYVPGKLHWLVLLVFNKAELHSSDSLVSREEECGSLTSVIDDFPTKQLSTSQYLPVRICQLFPSLLKEKAGGAIHRLLPG
jgi:hypothetical protein